MDFSKDIDAVLAETRTLGEDLMVDTCKITRKLKPGEPGYVEPEMDPDTLAYPSAPRKTIYEGRCRVQMGSTAAGIGFTEYSAGDRKITAQEPEVQLPVAGTEDVRPKDEIEIVTAKHDASLVGRVFTVLAPHRKTHATKRHLRVWEGVA